MIDRLLFFNCRTSNIPEPAPSKGCLLVVFKYSKASKKHPLEGLGILFIFDLIVTAEIPIIQLDSNRG